MHPPSTTASRTGCDTARHSRAKLVACLLALLALVAGDGVAAQIPSAPVQTLRIPESPLLVDHPAAWRPGGVRGHGVLVSLIGRSEGYPSFSVMSDPHFEPDPGAAPEDVEREIEALFEQLIEGQPEVSVESDGWTRVNGLRVHDSTTSWSTVTGRLKARRLLLVFGGRPYVLTWIEREDRYGEIAELVEHCARSLRMAEAPVVGVP